LQKESKIHKILKPYSTPFYDLAHKKVSVFSASAKKKRQKGDVFLLTTHQMMSNLKNRSGSKSDDFVESQMGRHPGESRGPDFAPTKVGNHLKDWIPAFAGMTNFIEFRLL